jgi:hypothetical protein
MNRNNNSKLRKLSTTTPMLFPTLYVSRKSSIFISFPSKPWLILDIVAIALSQKGCCSLSLMLREVSVQHIQQMSRSFTLKPTPHCRFHLLPLLRGWFKASGANAARALHCTMAYASHIRFRSTKRTAATATATTAPISTRTVWNQLFTHVPFRILADIFMVALQWVGRKHGFCFVELACQFARFR